MLVTNNPTVSSQPGICVSTATGYDFATGEPIQGVKLRVFRVYNGLKDAVTGFNMKIKNCDHDGKVFATKEECDKFCLEHGYLKVYRHGKTLFEY